MNVIRLSYLVLITFNLTSLFGQTVDEETPQKKVKETFYSTRIINGHSSELLEKKELEFRVEHKFGDMFGTSGGVHQFFGLDNSSDIRIAFEYGVSDRLMIGVGRSKGYGPYRNLLDGFAKFKIMSQTEGNEKPVSIAFLGSSTLTYDKASSDLTELTHYPDFAHRMAYASQFIVARKFSNWLSIAIMPTYVHRNYVSYADQNGLFALGGATHINFTKKFGCAIEYYHTFNQTGLREQFENSFSFALDWNTFGHVFSVYLTNAGGFTEQQFIPYTTGNWLNGQFRIGFAITRSFEL
jgi:hypothetical protein